MNCCKLHVHQHSEHMDTHLFCKSNTLWHSSLYFSCASICENLAPRANFRPAEMIQAIYKVCKRSVNKLHVVNNPRNNSVISKHSCHNLFIHVIACGLVLLISTHTHTVYYMYMHRFKCGNECHCLPLLVRSIINCKC